MMMMTTFCFCVFFWFFFPFFRERSWQRGQRFWGKTLARLTTDFPSSVHSIIRYMVFMKWARIVFFIEKIVGLILRNITSDWPIFYCRHFLQKQRIYFVLEKVRAGEEKEQLSIFSPLSTLLYSHPLLLFLSHFNYHLGFTLTQHSLKKKK